MNRKEEIIKAREAFQMNPKMGIHPFDAGAVWADLNPDAYGFKYSKSEQMYRDKIELLVAKLNIAVDALKNYGIDYEGKAKKALEKIYGTPGLETGEPRR